MLTRLHNRKEAGRRLSLSLQAYANRADVVVLGIPWDAGHGRQSSRRAAAANADAASTARSKRRWLIRCTVA